MNAAKLVLIFFVYLCSVYEVYAKKVARSVFDANWTSGMYYDIDHKRTNSHVSKYFQLSNNDGGLYLKRPLACDYPVTLNERSPGDRSPVKRADLPIVVLCRETSFQTDDHLIVILNQTNCLKKSQLVIGLKSLLLSESRRCSVNFGSPSDSRYVIEKSGGDLVASQPFCPQLGSSVIITANILCDIEQLQHIEIVFCSECNYMRSFIGRERRDMRNWPPSFQRDLYVAVVPEEREIGYHVTTVNTSDPEGGKVSYSLHAIVDARSQIMFEIGTFSGEIKTTSILDREYIDKHYLRIRAVDDGMPPATATAVLEVRVEDVNDHTPVFEQDIYYPNVRENSPLWTTVLTVRATDQDFGVNAELEYKLADDAPFRIDPFSGDITVIGKLDREATSEYDLEVIVTDLAEDSSQRRWNEARVIVTIEDDNDNYPQFTESNYNITIKEDIDWIQSTPVIHIQAFDADLGRNSEIRYAIIGGNTQGHFHLNAVTGVLSVASQIDYEAIRSYRLLVRAQDGGTPPRSNTTQLIINVVDVNDNSPQFYTDIIEELIAENVPLGHKIVLMQAYDSDNGDNGVIEYSIQKQNMELPFDIQKSTGWIITTGSVDREANSVYHFTVMAIDRGVPSRFSTCQVIIRIQDINDNDPVFDPKVYEVNISELSPPGSSVITVTARDDDSDSRLTYHISRGNMRDRFSVTSRENVGVISVAQPLDFDIERHFALTVVATDTGGRSDSALVYINVTDANTHRPIFEGTPYGANVPEDAPVGTTVLVVEALDGDEGENARITYSMDHVPEFTMDTFTGAIVTAKRLDRELVSGYSLVVMARDYGMPPLSDTTNVEIEVSDINDNSPVFHLPKYISTVSEDVLVGTSVIQVLAPDSDIGLNGQVRYSLETNSENIFSIDPTSGVIRTERLLDRESVSSYHLTVKAMDRGSPPLSANVSVTIRVDDVNDNPPTFNTDRISLFVTENTGQGSVVGEIEATDPDEGANAVIYYSIVDGPDSHLFFLLPHPGKSADLISKTEFDYESPKKRYSFVIRASSPPLRQDVDVDVWVTDVNDNAPVLKDFLIIANIYGNYLPRESLGCVPATDADVGDQLQYRILSTDSWYLLDIEVATGVIRFHPKFEDSQTLNAELEIGVFDGINEVTANCHLLIRRVTDMMLKDSVTIRLEGITEKAFISSMYEEFLDSIAVIIPCSKNDVVIFSIKDDTEVIERILNISFSIKFHGTERLYSRKTLEALIYLKRSFLSKLLRTEVLPFEDDLCVHEPCVSYEECHSITKYGNTSKVIDSEVLIFHSIHPMNTFSCKCPVGFTGMNHKYECDTEINLCYSSPCGNNGKCEQKENGYSCICKEGYTGAKCEINIAEGRCTTTACFGNSYCLNQKQKGFQCLNCTYDPLWSTELCQLRTRSFHKGSYLTLPTLHHRHRLHIKLKFATYEKNALLFYNSRYNERHDFITLEIVSSQVVFTFSVGADIRSVSVFTVHGVSDGQWHNVEVSYLNRSVTLNIDSCDTVLALRFGRVLGSYHCANTTTYSLEKKCTDPMQTCHRFLDLTGPLQIGGLPASSTAKTVKRYFSGCISDIYIDHQLIDLTSFIDNNGTEPGCKRKSNFCESHPCSNDGICEEGWNTFICHCQEGFVGKDCNKEEKLVKQFSGKGFLVYIPPLYPIQLPWSVSLSFRTRNTDGLLIQLQLGVSSEVKLEITKGIIQYSFNNETVHLNNIYVDDGKWHNIEALWTTNHIVLNLDYAQFKVQKEFKGSIKAHYVGKISVGGLEKLDDGRTTVHFVGCIKDVRVGNTGDLWLRPVVEDDVSEGCFVSNSCDSNPCPLNSQCTDLWNNYTCRCHLGYVGEYCQPVCDLNPCVNGGKCVNVVDAENMGYKCSCNEEYTGKYCEIYLNQTCPSMWWGSPICGPCNCNVAKGYDASCNKTTGECVCEENHYQLDGSDLCIPCNCYTVGSYNNHCDHITGQCHCRPGVIGQQCDSCSSPFAEVTLRGCEVIYDGCPRSYSNEIWWNRTPFDHTSTQACPEGANGNAKRHCSLKGGWQKPNLFDCTTNLILPLQKELSIIKGGPINSTIANEIINSLSLIHNLQSALFGNDIIIIFQLLHFILNHEIQLDAQNLSHYQNNNFIKNIVLTVSRILNPVYIEHWEHITILIGKGPEYLLKLLEKYMSTLIQQGNAEGTEPFEIVAENLVLGVDTIEAMVYFSHLQKNSSNHLSALPFLEFNVLPGQELSVILPKYNNYANQKKSRGDTSLVIIPLKLITSDNLKDKHDHHYNYFKFCHLIKDCARISYAIYPTMGKLLSSVSDTTVKKLNEKLTEINSDVFTIVMHPVKLLPLPENITFRFQVLAPEEHENVKCVHWTHNEGERGMWSSDGCTVMNQYYDGIYNYVNCSCNHLSSFSLLMDITPRKSFVLESDIQGAFSYFGILVSLLMLLATLMVFHLLRSNETNSNKIHTNLVSSIFIANFIFLIALKTQDNHSQQEFSCKMMAILLHYFFLCEFCWIFVESVHLYRMLTLMQDINHGQMKHYYFIGYGVPAIIVGFAVGIHADQYGNNIFCWLSVHDSVVWSLVAPICILVVLVLGIFAFSVHSTVEVKETITDFGNVRTVLWIGIMLLPILGATWILAVLCVNESIKALHYMFILFCLIEGVYVFCGYCVINKKVRQYLFTLLTQLIDRNMSFVHSLNGINTNMQSKYHAPFKVLHRSVGISTCSTASQSTGKTLSTPCRSNSQYQSNIISIPPNNACDSIIETQRQMSSVNSEDSPSSLPSPVKLKQQENEVQNILTKDPYVKSSPNSYHSSRASFHTDGISESNNETPHSNSLLDVGEFQIPPLKLPQNLLCHAKYQLPSLSSNEKIDNNSLDKQSFHSCEMKDNIDSNSIKSQDVGSLLESRFSPPLIDDTPDLSDSEDSYSITINHINSKPLHSESYSPDLNRTSYYQCSDFKPRTAMEESTKRSLELNYQVRLVPPLATAELTDSE